MSDNEICDAMRTLLLGGHDTTASTLTWMLERVSRSPRRARAPRKRGARRRRRIPRRGDQGDDAPAPGLPTHRAARFRALRAAGLTIPSGTMVVPYITLVHRRPELYPDPLAFRPERFLDTRAGTYTWIPFGGGPRRCIGAAFSMAEARIVLRTILRQARIEPSRPPLGAGRAPQRLHRAGPGRACHAPTPHIRGQSPTGCPPRRPGGSRLTQPTPASSTFSVRLAAVRSSPGG